MTKEWSDFLRYFSEHTEGDGEKLREVVTQAIAQNISNIHPAILVSVPGLVNVVCSAVCGGVMDMLERYHKWREEQC